MATLVGLHFDNPAAGSEQAGSRNRLPQSGHAASIIARMGLPRVVFSVVIVFLGLLLPLSIKAQTTASWSGVVHDPAGEAVAAATIELSASGRIGAEYQATS